MRTTILIIAAATLALTGCGQASPDPTPSAAPRDAGPYVLTDDDWRVALDITWADAGTAAQADMCWGWDHMGPAWVLDGLSDSGAPEHLIIEHFLEKC